MYSAGQKYRWHLINWKRFNSNKKRLINWFTSQPEYEKKQIEKEKEKLEETVATLSEEDKSIIHKRGTWS